VQHVYFTCQLAGAFGVEEGISGDGGKEAHALSDVQKSRELAMEERLPPSEVYNPDPQAPQIAQVLEKVFYGSVGGRLLPNVAEAASGITAVGEVIVA